MKEKLIKLYLIYCFMQLFMLVSISYFFNLALKIFFIFALFLSLWTVIILLFLLLRKKGFCSVDGSFILKNINTKIFKLIFPFFLSIVFLADFADGYAARKKNQLTRIGQILDSVSGYVLIALISIVYKQIDILAACFFYLILGRLLFQGAAVLFLFLDYPMPAVSAAGVKTAIAAVMIFYVLKILQFVIYISQNIQNIFQMLEYICAFIIFVFTLKKINIFYFYGKKYL